MGQHVLWFSLSQLIDVESCQDEVNDLSRKAVYG